MNWIDTLEQKYRRYAIENLATYLVVGQIIATVLAIIYRPIAGYFFLEGSNVYRGEIWRLVTFLFSPVLDNLLFAVFAWYMLYLCGTMLERRWGSFRYTIYILLSWIGSIVTALIFPLQGISNGYIYASQFIAFAYLYPEVVFTLFFILPVKAKWLGILAWIGIAATVLLGTAPSKVLAILSIGNFFLFFGTDLIYYLRTHRWSIHLSTSAPSAVNTCVVCGKKEINNPTVDFRYCSQCNPPACYCPDHLQTHAHRLSAG